ncbi:MAG TPA: hypothetical protein VMS08_05290 [Candidatus Saccharimonadia bacterium]|nr:hypothetical protein [Candidatus Saccharimonadia bacterium]
MGWLLSTKQRAELETLIANLRAAGVTENDEGVKRLKSLPRTEVIKALSHLLASVYVLGTNEAALSEKDYRRLALKFVDAAARLGEGEEFGDAESRQNYLAGDLAADIDATIHPPEHDVDFGDLSASSACHQLATELYEELIVEPYFEWASDIAARHGIGEPVEPYFEWAVGH